MKGEEEDGGGAALLPGSQAALLTATADGTLRVWVEVTLAPALGTDGASPGWRPGPRTPGDSPRGAASPGGPPPDALAARVSRFCVTLVVAPPPGAWEAPGPGRNGGPGVRAYWGVPAGPGPTTGAQLRAARVLWIVGVGPAGTHLTSYSCSVTCWPPILAVALAGAGRALCSL